MPLSAPVRDIRCPSESGCVDADRSKFVHCVDGRNPKVHEVWIWGDDGITTKFHPTARVDVDYWITRNFPTD